MLMGELYFQLPGSRVDTMSNLCTSQALTVTLKIYNLLPMILFVNLWASC